MCDVKSVNDNVFDEENAGLPRAGRGATDVAGSIDTSEVSRVVGVRTLTDFFCWAQPLIDDIGTSAVHWTSSTAFSGIGCPELAA